MILAGILSDADFANLPEQFAPYVAEQCQEFKIVLKKAVSGMRDNKPQILKS